MSNKNRIEFVDLAKGVCIILMVLRHSEIELPLLHYLRMPFYFLVSGLFFRTYGGIATLSAKKTNKLLIPFVFFYCMPYIIFYPCDTVLGTNFLTNNSFLGDLSGMAYYNNPIWFLICLFWCNLLFYFSKIPGRNWLCIFVNMLYCAVGMLLWHEKVFIPLHLSTALMAMPFFCLGNLLASTNLLYKNRFDRWNLPAAILILAVLIILGRGVGLEANVEWYTNSFEGNPLVYFVFAMLMVLASLLLCKTIKRLPFVSYCGRYSIIILGTHWIFVGLVQRLMKHFDIGQTAQSLCIFALVMAASAIMIPLLKKFLPHLVAQKDIIKTHSNTEKK